MRRGLIAAAAAVGLAVAMAPAYAAVEKPDPRIQSDGRAAGVVQAHGTAGNASSRAGHGTDPRLVYHNGPVVTGSTFVQPIYWGTSWTQSNDQVVKMQAFYGGVGNSAYLKTNKEYTNASGTHVSPAVSVATSALIDNAAAPSGGPSTSTILGEVAHALSVAKIAPQSNGYYPVYIDQPRGNLGYCAWHSAGSINGTSVTFAFFFKLDGDPGCDPGSSVTSYSEGVAAVANVSGHELSEMVTDPQLNAWYDRSGNENADKCAWQFNGYSNFGGYQWLIQGNWSNAAYASQTGGYGSYKGCIVSSA